jgi:transposase
VRPGREFVARARPQAAEAGQVRTVEGSRVRGQGRRHRRPVSGPARRRGRAQPGRETQIQALDRTQSLLPIEFDRSGQRAHDYVRHGTTNLFAALNVGTGEVIGDCAPSRNGPAFLAFLKKAVAPYAGREIRVVLDNLSTHTTPELRAWLDANPNVHFHFTPKGSSWLNQIEIWFGIITARPSDAAPSSPSRSS